MSLEGNNLQIYANNPNVSGGSIINTTGIGSFGADTNGVVIYTAGSNGSRVYDVLLSSSVGTSMNVFIYILNGSNVYPLNYVNIPGDSGSSASTPCVDALSTSNCPGLPFDSTGKPYIELAIGSTLKFSSGADVPGGDSIIVSTIGCDY